MEPLRPIAYEIVLRACGFASLAIFCIMIGLSFAPARAFQAGGFLTTMMSLVLIYKAQEAKTKNHRRTEMWLYLEDHQRPPAAHAQLVVAMVMRDTYLKFAGWTSAVAIAMWVLALIFSALALDFSQPQ